MEEKHQQPDGQSYEQQILHLLQQISLIIAQADSLDGAFAGVLAAICRFMGWPLGHAYLWSEASDTLVSSGVWYTAVAHAAATAPFRALSEATSFRRGEGTVGKAWQEATAVSILDVRQETTFVRQLPEAGIRAYFAFPVLVGGKVTAVLEFFSPTSAPLDRDMTSIISHVGALLGLALQRQQTVRELSALMEVGQAISATLDFGRIYDQVLTLVRPLIGAESLILFVFKEQLAEPLLEIVANDQTNMPDMRGLRVPFHLSVAGEVWQTGASLHLQGDECIDRISPKIRELMGYRPEAMLAVPLRWRDTAVGVLEATHHRADAFTADDMRLLEMAAAWTAIAMGNARQYEQLQRRFSERDAIVTITHALTETLELEALLQLITHMAQEIIPNADWATIHIWQPKTNRLALAASAGLETAEAGAETNLRVLDEGIAGRIMIVGEVINIPDMQSEPHLLTLSSGVQARSLLVAPVESRLRRIGAISVQGATPGIFDEDDERLLKILGVQAGMAIENARLYADQRQAREKAEKQRERMRHMARRVMQAQEAERVRIARELHDESGQALTSLKISLDLIRSLLPEELSDIRQSLADVLALTDQTMSNLRLLSHNLRPPGLDAFGLDAALAGLCQDFQTHTPLLVTYTGVALPELAPLPALALYRVAQEALTNISKHAQATQAQVSLTQDSDMITLTITDNGSGFTPPNFEEALPVQGAGLVGMVERLDMVNGRLHIESTPGQGSRLTAVVPYTREET
ncbi:MAG: GAF domain-containing protein [Anaerolineae bacterium]|nr:GAF domain-containing protein [Anaerolineae bacterium]